MTPEETRDLIAEVKNKRAFSVYGEGTAHEDICRLADALEARQPSVNDRDALKRIAEVASEQRLKESIGEWRNALGAGIDSFPDDWELEFWHAGYKHGALAMIEHQLSRAAVPDAATESAAKYIRVQAKANARWRRLANKTIRDVKAERDAALAAIERVRAVCLHLGGVDGDVSQPAPSYYVSVGRNVVATEVLAVLDGAPEPEWEYRVEYQVPGGATHVSGTMDSLEEARGFELENIHGGVVVRRRKAGPWLPVEGSET